MHPLEQLRYLSWGWGAGEALPAQEVAAALADLAATSPRSLVQACRRLIERYPAEGVAWWLCARALSAPDAVEGIWDAASELAEDPTPAALAEAMATGRRAERAVAVTVAAAGPGEVLLGTKEARRVSSARAAKRPVWAVVPRGRLLPGALWAALLARSGPGCEILAVEAFSCGVGEAGVAPLRQILSGPTCPPVAELLDWRY
jgi:hypothetical protein